MARIAGAFVLAAAAALAGAGEAGPQTTTVGWRGNWTGLYPQADPPIEWHRTPRGIAAGLTCQAARPADGAAKAAQPVADGLPRDWLVLGPLEVGSSLKDFAAQQVPGEADLAPAEGLKVGELAWKRLHMVKPPQYVRWGTTELDWIDVGEAVGYKPNAVAYAHTYLHSPRGGKLRVVLEHTHGLKAWVNGQAVYECPKVATGLGSYVGISRTRKALTHSPSPSFEADLKPGWNRLLIKVASYHLRGWREMRFVLRLMDAGPIEYDEKNIAWITPLPDRSNGCPIVVGDRLFVTAEPDLLLCVDKPSGRVLWRRVNGFYDAAASGDGPEAAALRAKIGPLARQLEQTEAREDALAIRRQMRDLLIAADKGLDLKWDGHFEAHFGIIGFSTTPVSDGKSVYAFYGNGVVACYDLAGVRKWIRRLPTEELGYTCSPALAGGRMMLIFNGLTALDAATGEVAWHLPKVRSIASLIPARIAGTDVVATREGDFFRASDGRQMWSNPRKIKNDTGWAAPVVLGDLMYVPWFGMTTLISLDFAAAAGEPWQPKEKVLSVQVVNHRPSGEWLDHPTAGSPLVVGDVVYLQDIYAELYALDLRTGKTLYRKEAGFDPMHHYNAIGMAASLVLGGRHIYATGDQGRTVVYEPGGDFRVVARNRIATTLSRDWPVPPQETISYCPPVFDGRHIFIRGERNLYCIGPKSGGETGK